MDDIKDRVKRIISNQLEVEVDNLSDTASLFEDLGADSIDTVELIIAFEVEFDIEIPDKEAESLFTLNDIYRYIEKKKSDK
ncbi:MAG TPA: acyl carrier protein [Spirochaetota bacterium]|nr:acyl carrier protein [Spirochaetota bacterium]HPJ33774.1 acyl carrier protein [Spirochaetota bacterium]